MMAGTAAKVGPKTGMISKTAAMTARMSACLTPSIVSPRYTSTPHDDGEQKLSLHPEPYFLRERRQRSQHVGVMRAGRHDGEEVVDAGIDDGKIK